MGHEVGKAREGRIQRALRWLLECNVRWADKSSRSRDAQLDSDYSCSGSRNNNNNTSDHLFLLLVDAHLASRQDAPSRASRRHARGTTPAPPHDRTQIRKTKLFAVSTVGRALARAGDRSRIVSEGSRSRNLHILVSARLGRRPSLPSVATSCR